MLQPEETDLLDIQTTLRADTSGVARAALDRRLEESGLLLKRQMDAGVAPADFASLSAMHSATEVAREIVAVAWKGMHGNSC